MSEETKTITYEFNGKPIVYASSTPRKKKGSEESTWYMYPFFERPAEVQTFVTANIDSEKFWSAVYRELIKPAAADAYNECIEPDSDTGEVVFNSAKFTQLFLEQFEPSSRRSSGPSSKDLKDRLAGISTELAAAFAAYESEKTEETHMRLQRLVMEMSELTGKLQAKQRPASATPRKPRKKKEEAAAVTA